MNIRKTIKKNWSKIVLFTFLLTNAVISCNAIADNIKQDIADARAESISAKAGEVVAVAETKTPSKKVIEYAVPLGDTSFKSYMSYKAITNTDSKQYKLQKSCWTDKKGLRRYNNDYVIALGSYYADYIGQRFTITLDSGKTFTAVVGDFKANKHTDESNKYTPMEDGKKNVIEFIVDTDELDKTARKMGDISYAGFKGNVESIERTVEFE